MGVMPPWFIEKDRGIQHYKDDISLSDDEIEAIAAWVDNGAPRGDPADMPSALPSPTADAWDIGEPELIVDTPVVSMRANEPDYWGALPPTPTGLMEDRYVSAVQFKEVGERAKGGQFLYHHAIHSMVDADGEPAGVIGSVFNVGRNAEVFVPDAAPLMKAESQIVFGSIHLQHANDEDTTARLRIAYKFHPKGYEPTQKVTTLMFGTGEIVLRPNTDGQEIHFYTTLQRHTKLTTFEPHLHAAGVRMCLESIWAGRTETLSCAGYDHNWVKVYKYADDAAPLLPKGTLLHVTAYFNTTATNKNVIDPRNWGGLGHRSIDNMAILIGPVIPLTDTEFENEMAIRRQRLGLAKG